MADGLLNAHDGGMSLGTRRRPALLPWLTCLLAVALASTAVALDGQRTLVGADDIAVNFALALSYPLAGALILTYRPRHPIGVLLCFVGLASSLELASLQYATRAIVLAPGSLPAGGLAAWISSWVWALGAIPALTLLPALFPDGSLPSRRWWPVVAAGLGSAALSVMGHALWPGPIESFPSVHNPIGVTALRLPTAVMRVVAVPLFFVALVAAAAAVVSRWRQGGPLIRRQLTPFVLTTALFAAVGLSSSLHLLPERLSFFLVVTAGPLVPASIVVAVLRYRLYDVDVVLNRSLVYAALSAGIVAVYVAVVTAVGQVAGQLTGSVLGAAAVAIAFQPFRQQIQAGVDRLMYGDRREPYLALSRLGSRLGGASSPAALLPAVAEGVSEALRVPGARMEVVQGERLLASATHGALEVTPETFPVSYQDHVVGRLVVAHRFPGEGWSSGDRRLLEDLLWHAGLAAHMVGLTSELQRSREEAVTAREEERRRVRRDLHDGLGPVLAGLALGLEGAQDAIEHDRDTARKLLSELSTQAYATIEDVRQLVYGLRPPSLDELGLLGAVREQADRLSRPSTGMVVTVEAPEPLPPLPAAVEVAAYRIVAEALTNVSRHSRAGRCVVRIRVEDGLDLSIEDDGVGLRARNGHGVGMSSMAERAAELGGACAVESVTPSGTRVAAHLPMAPS